MIHPPNESHDAMSRESHSPRENSSGRTEAWSHRFVWISVLVLVGVVSWNGWRAYQHNSQIADFRCDEPIFDFGQVFVGDVVNHKFRIGNVSRNSIEIDKVIASCGCTTLGKDLGGLSVAPGASFEVPVKLTLSKSEQGVIERQIVVRFREHPDAQLTLRLKGRVLNRWSWSTNRVVFDKVASDAEATREVELTLHPNALQVESAPTVHSSGNSPIQVTVKPDQISPANRSWRVFISTKPPVPPGRHEVALMTNLEDCPPLQVVIVAAE